MKLLKKILRRVIRHNNTSVVELPIAKEIDEKDSTSRKRDIDTIRTSLLFNEKWYREKYELGEYCDVAEHYLLQGWKEGKNPSDLFSTDEYLAMYPEVSKAGINPLLHFEQEGFEAGYYAEKIKNKHDKIKEENPQCIGSMEHGLLRVRMTNACNAKCRYCGVRLGFGSEKEHEMDKKFYYEYCKPIYSQLNMILLTGGDPYITQESYNYMKYLGDNYPHITVFTESNGIAFDEKFQNLAMNNLFSTHFSLNASNEDVYAKSCWEGPGGEAVYSKFMKNIQDYVSLLERNDLLVFAPDYSMVINNDNYFDIVDFVKLCLRLHANKISFYFDYTENNMNASYFGTPELIRPVLKQLMELERVLAGKIILMFRLWIPIAEVEPMQKQVEAVSLSCLKEKYADILEMASNRCVDREFARRNELRKQYGKRELSFAEDFYATVRYVEHNGENICFAPWHELDLYPNGRIDVCGWVNAMANINDYVVDGVVDWEHLINSYKYMSMRKKMLFKNYQDCMACCPMNEETSPAETMVKYGYERKFCK